MKLFKRYFAFSKVLVFALIIAFFAILAFDGYIVLELMQMIRNGVSLMYATVIGTVVSVMSTFSNGVILFAVRGYLDKSAKENVVGYDSKTGTIADERMKSLMNNMYEPTEEGA